MKPGNRPFLLYSSVDSERACYRRWIADGDRNFDVALTVYRGELQNADIEVIRTRRGFKFPNFVAFCDEFDISDYQAVWVVDDDIQLSTQEINRLFETAIQYDLALAQPAYSADSCTNWNLLYVDALYHLRYSNFVENGVTLFSRAALQKCLPVMRDINTGHGAEFVFINAIAELQQRVAVIDDVVCHHPLASSALDVEVPREAHANDDAELMRKYHCGYFVPQILGGVARNG